MYIRQNYYISNSNQQGFIHSKTQEILHPHNSQIIMYKYHFNIK